MSTVHEMPDEIQSLRAMFDQVLAHMTRLSEASITPGGLSSGSTGVFVMSRSARAS